MESLKDSARWGWSPKARQIRRMVVWLIPTALAIERVDQWVASVGLLLQGLDDHRFDLVVADGARHTRPRVVGQPVEAMLDEAAAPLADRGLGSPRVSGDVTVGVPLGAANTIRARRAMAWALLRRLASRSSVSRSSVLSTNSAFGRPPCPSLPPIVADDGRNAPLEAEIPDFTRFLSNLRLRTLDHWRFWDTTALSPTFS